MFLGLSLYFTGSIIWGLKWGRILQKWEWENWLLYGDQEAQRNKGQGTRCLFLVLNTSQCHHITNTLTRVNPFIMSEPSKCNHFPQTNKLATKSSIMSLWGADWSREKDDCYTVSTIMPSNTVWQNSRHKPAFHPPHSDLGGVLCHFPSHHQTPPSRPALAFLMLLQTFAFTSFLLCLITDSSLGSCLHPTAVWQIPSKIKPVTHQWIFYSICVFLPPNLQRAKRVSQLFSRLLTPSKKDCLGKGNKDVAWALSELLAYQADTQCFLPHDSPSSWRLYFVMGSPEHNLQQQLVQNLINLLLILNHSPQVKTS